MLLDADVQAGVLVDRDGRLRGIVTVGMVADGSAPTSAATSRGRPRASMGPGRAAALSPDP